MVTGRVRNMRQLGPYIHRLCYGRETYRLRRRSQRQRELTHLLPFPVCSRPYEMLNHVVTCAGSLPLFATLLFFFTQHEMLSDVTCAGLV